MALDRSSQIDEFSLSVSDLSQNLRKVPEHATNGIDFLVRHLTGACAAASKRDQERFPGSCSDLAA